MVQKVLYDLSLIQANGGANAIMISHAHLDHTGSLPILSLEFPNAKIYMTHATKDLTQVLLADSLKIIDHKEGEILIYAEVARSKRLGTYRLFLAGIYLSSSGGRLYPIC